MTTQATVHRSCYGHEGGAESGKHILGTNLLDPVEGFNLHPWAFYLFAVLKCWTNFAFSSNFSKIQIPHTRDTESPNVCV